MEPSGEGRPSIAGANPLPGDLFLVDTAPIGTVEILDEIPILFTLNPGMEFGIRQIVALEIEIIFRVPADADLGYSDPVGSAWLSRRDALSRPSFGEK
jgi:hypothetical protein